MDVIRETLGKSRDLHNYIMICSLLYFDFVFS